MVGRTYLERGEPVVVVARWRDTPPVPLPPFVAWHPSPPRPTAPRNVLIRRADGTLACRSFRGLRRPL